jgi:hypothetical protein
MASKVLAAVMMVELKTKEFLAFQMFQSTTVMMVERALGEASSVNCGRSQRSLKETMYLATPPSNRLPQAGSHGAAQQ